MEQEEIVSLTGVNLYIVQRGDGAPVVLIGGPWFGQYYLQPLAEDLASDFHVITYDPRGAGRSDVLSAEKINLAGHLHDLEELRRALGLDRLNLIGHSLGALVCLAYAVTYPEQTGALVLANPGPPLDPELHEMLGAAFMNALTAEDQEALESIQAMPGFAARDARIHEEYFRILYSAFFPRREVISRLDFGFTPATAQYALEAEEQLVEQLMEMGLTDRLEDVRSPALVIHSELDLIPEAFSRYLAGSIPGAEMAFLGGVGHFAYLEDPALVRRTISDFLRPLA